jgi:hypothetical protein
MKRVKNAQPKRSKAGGFIVFCIFAIIGICIVMSSCQAGNFRASATDAINTVAPVVDATQSAWQAGYQSALAQANANAQSQQSTTQYPVYQPPVYNPPVNVPQQTVVYQTQPVAPPVVYTTPVISYNSQPSWYTPPAPRWTAQPYSPTPWVNRRDDTRRNERPQPRHDQPNQGKRGFR